MMSSGAENAVMGAVSGAGLLDLLTELYSKSEKDMPNMLPSPQKGGSSSGNNGDDDKFKKLAKEIRKRFPEMKGKGKNQIKKEAVTREMTDSPKEKLAEEMRNKPTRGGELEPSMERTTQTNSGGDVVEATTKTVKLPNGKEVVERKIIRDDGTYSEAPRWVDAEFSDVAKGMDFKSLLKYIMAAGAGGAALSQCGKEGCTVDQQKQNSPLSGVKLKDYWE